MRVLVVLGQVGAGVCELRLDAEDAGERRVQAEGRVCPRVPTLLREDDPAAAVALGDAAAYLLAAALCLLTLLAVQRRTFAAGVPAKEPA